MTNASALSSSSQHGMVAMVFLLFLLFAELVCASSIVHRIASEVTSKYSATTTAACPPWTNTTRIANITIGDLNAPSDNVTYPVSLIDDALALVPQPNLYPFTIALAPVIFEGALHIRVGNVSLIGCGMYATHLRFNNSTNLMPTLPNSYDVATLMIEADDVTIEHVHIANVWNDPWELGPNPPPVPANVTRQQAVALVLNADRIAIRHSYVYGYQDTLLTAGGTAYMHNCTILGCTDFIFGSGTLLIEESRIDTIYGGWITAAATPENQTYGIVFRNCHVTFNSSYGNHPPTKPAGLGRTWHQLPMVTYINTTIDSTKSIDKYPWVSMGNETINGTGTSVCHARLAEYHTRFPDGSTNYTIDHPASCPLPTTPIIAATELPSELEHFYKRSVILGGWEPEPANDTRLDNVDVDDGNDNDDRNDDDDDGDESSLLMLS